jgi:hypothetical protein
LETQKECLDYLENKFGMNHWEDWYEIKEDDVSNDEYGNILLKKYDGCLITALKNILPNNPWQIWRFEHKNLSSQYWESEENVKEYITWLEVYYQYELEFVDIDYGFEKYIVFNII